MSDKNLVSTVQIARAFNTTRDSVHKWRRRYPDHPKPVTTNPYPLYDLHEIERWYANKWPERTGIWQSRLHHFQVSPEGVRLTTTDIGPLERAKGFLQGIRQAAYADWRTYVTDTGFSAHRGNEIEVYVIDPTGAEPEPWHYYDTKYKTTGRVK